MGRPSCLGSKAGSRPSDFRRTFAIERTPDPIADEGNGCLARHEGKDGGDEEEPVEETTQFTIGAKATCSDGDCGEVTRVVIDPIAEEVTHLVVEPRHPEGQGRLVPLSLIDADASEVRIGCTLAEFARLDPAEETQFVPGPAPYPPYEPQQVLAWPYYGLGIGSGLGLGSGLAMGGIGMGDGPVSQAVTYDTVPLGEVTVRRGEPVLASDGEIGRVQGLVIDSASRHVTHVLLQEGHLWGRKEVAIPIGAVASTDSGIQLKITKKDVADLPPLPPGQPGGQA
jgi:sporulation protein YlmC with PRC-barrel domain